MAMARSVVQRHEAARDRISELPVAILDHIVGFLPIQEAAKTAVLSKVWRDVWLGLSRLCFDENFFRCCDRMNRVGRFCSIKSLFFYVISKVLSEHKGYIQKFVCHDSKARTRTGRSRSFRLDWWLSLVGPQGVEEISLRVGRYEYKLPDWMFSCSTLKRLHLCGVLIEPRRPPCAFPNVTTLSFESVCFRSTNPSGYVVDVPKLESLSFINCEDVFHFSINARNICSLTIKCCSSSQLGEFLPVNLDLRSIRTLEMDIYTLQAFLGQYTTKGIALQLPLLNVELLKLSNFCFEDNAMISALVCLLCRCPKLRKLEIEFEFGCTGEINKYIDATPGDLKNLRGVVRKHKMLLSLKISSFNGLRPQMHFIKEMLACLPALEEVVIVCLPRLFDWNEERDILEEILHFPCASPKANITYR